ncbi:PIG-L family deacetylase [Mycobacterium sp. CVI_P3]|uniref:PIG-L family deacetylase n=1 Tax=Mycobacterium pinniadriaticum TaxID=2994102 RepID=A0ABT3SIU9_9MYCO|nr:PIG-L family deacetylase [Mycobacterium pinniadriaticum]MCX2932874.1 PIG-L family deacetylase [Mycobacterium pinniadriaticum]MCX2939297.1 PIG-L family deacetylase [Mycobacterium pinniadriaticum]
MTPDTASNSSRFARVPLSERGTATEEWLPWQRGLPRLPLELCPGLVVVAPHPDDETLGFGAAALSIAARGVTVQTIIASDGGAAWPDLSVTERAKLERCRRNESRRAAAVLGLPQPTFLGLPDGGLADQESRLADILSTHLSARGAGTWCAATWRGDGHPDHEAVGRAAAVAVSRTDSVLVEYPVWMWHWARLGQAGIPWQHAARVVPDPDAAQRKRLATEVFQSQLVPGGANRDPVLPRHVLARLQSVGEVVFR